MSKHHQKSTHLPQLGKPFEIAPGYPVKSDSITSRLKKSQAKAHSVTVPTRKHKPQETQPTCFDAVVRWLYRLGILILSMGIIQETVDSSLLCDEKSATCGYNTLYLSLMIAGLSEYVMWQTQKTSRDTHQPAPRQSVSIPRALALIYAGILCFYFVIVIIPRHDLNAVLITMPAVAFGFGLHIVSVVLRCALLAFIACREELYFDIEYGTTIPFRAWLHNLPLLLRYFTIRFLDQFAPPHPENRYAISEEGEIDYFIGGDDDSRYELNDDGEIEKVKRG